MSPTPPRRGRAALRHAGPFLLLRHPALLLAVTLGSLLLALAAATYPLFLSATTSELVRGAIERPIITRYGAGLTYTLQDLPFGRSDSGQQDLLSGRGLARARQIGTSFRAIASGSPTLAGPIDSILGAPLTVSSGGRSGEQLGRLFSSTGALDQVERLAGRPGDGAWVPDLIADDLGIRPGDSIRLRDPEGGPSVDVPVDGVYRALLATPRGGYWLPWSTSFSLRCLECEPPPQPILVDRERLLELERELDETSATFRWLAPLAGESLSLEQAVALERHLDDVQEEVSFPDGRFGKLFLCCRKVYWGARIRSVRSAIYGVTVTSFATSIGYVVDEAEKRVVAVDGPARVLEVAGIAVAIVVVAAAGAFSIRARRVEAAWLFARGRSAALVGAKAAVETLLPCIAGGVIGLGLAAVLVFALGPSGPVDRSAFVEAALATGVAVVGAVALIALVSARTYVRVVDPHGRRLARVISAVPWELGLVGLAVVALQRLREGGAFITDERLDVVRPSLALVGFPFLLLGGLAVLAARLALAGFTWLRRPTASARPAPYLAVRRLASGGAFAMLLVAGAALCLGTFLHAQIVSRSLQSTVEAKAEVFVGSDVSGTVIATSPPEGFPYPVTRVVQAGEGARLPSGRTLDLLAIDPDTFAQAAYWNDAFDDASLPDLLDRLRPRDSGPLPIILAAGGDLPIAEIDIGTASVPVEVVARPIAFPGLYSRRPLVVADERALVDRLDIPYNPLTRFGAELWVRGDPDGIRVALSQLPQPPFVVATAEEVRDIPYVAAAIDTFLVVNALGTIAAALTFVGMLMYLQSRQRSQVVSYALATRMGMGHAQHRRALVLELGAMLAFAFAVGAGLAFVAARVTVPRLDPISTIPPAPLLVLPLALAATALALVAISVWSGAALTNRRARAIDLGEVMRVAE